MSHRNIAGKKRKASLLGNVPTTSAACPEVSGSSPAEPKYGYWSDEEQDLLFEWLGLPGNFEKWKCGGKMKADKKIRAHGTSKKSLATLISTYFKQNQKTKSTDQIINKMRYIEDRYKKVKDFLNSTGEGFSTNDEKMSITSIREKVLERCPFYDKVHPLMKDSVSITPPSVGESGVSQSISNIFFSDSAVRGDFESLEEEDDYDKAPDDEDVPHAEEFARLSPPTQQAAAPQMPETGVQPEPSRTSQRRGPAPSLTPNMRNLNKKPKSIGEEVVDLQKESRSILEKKLEATLEHQKLKLEFQRQESERRFALEQQESVRRQQESERRFALESRRLDLEQQSLELKRMTLEFEIEKLKRSS